MKRRGKTLTKPKAKSSRGLRNAQNDSSEDEPLVVSKVIKQYTRKKKVDSAESVNKLTCMPPIKVGAAWSEQSNSVLLVNNQNHVNIKEKIMERYPDIEIMAVDIETGNHVKTEERSVSQNGVNIEDNSIEIKEENLNDSIVQNVGNDLELNHVKTEKRIVSQNVVSVEDNSIEIKEENVNDSVVQNVGNYFELNCPYSKESSNEKTQETGVSKTSVTIIDINVHQIGSNKNNNNIKIKKENVSDRVMDDSNPTETVMQIEEIIIKIEPDDDLLTNLEQENVSNTDALQSVSMPAVETKQETENNDCSSPDTNDKLDSSCKNNVKNLSIHKPQQMLQVIANEAVQSENITLVMDDSNPTETAMQTEEIIIKMEPDDDLQCTNLEQKIVSHTDAPQSVNIPAVETKQETENNDCNSPDTNDKLDSSCKSNVNNLCINKPQQILQVIANEAVQRKILITEEIHIKDEVIIKPNINGVKVKDKAPVVNKKKEQVLNKEPALEKVKLTRIVTNMPRLLRTYGRKQPETTAMKKCFLVAVHSPSAMKNILSRQQLAKIKEKAAKAKVFICDMCGRNFRSKGSVSGHMRYVHSVAMKHKCGLCSASFPHYYLLLAHIRDHSGLPFACDLCPKLFKSKEKYGEHLNTHLRERLFPCPVCLRRFAILSHLQRHAEKHTPEDTFSCATCQESYRSFMDLTRHSERDHGEKAEFPCYVCNRILSSNAEFLTHVKTHDNVMYPCAFCPRRFNDTEKWEEHSNEHIGKIGNGETLLKPYTCDYCKKSFEYQSTLKTHIRMHTGERPYECPECTKRLKTQSALTEHINAHKRPFPCPQCNKMFGKKDSVSRHMLLHTGERPHACTGCPLTFVQRSAMLLHMRRFHEPGLKRVRKTKKNVKKTKLELKKERLQKSE